MVNRDKIEKITQLHESRGSHDCTLILSILNIIIQEIRESNDSCDPTELRFNQGKIEAFNELRRYILSGILPEGLR
jgi:hypothetical protein